MITGRLLFLAITATCGFSWLQGQYEYFNINDQWHTEIDHCVLSPDGSLLAVNHHDAQMTTIWDVKKKTMYTRIAKPKLLFFSSDSTRLYAHHNLILICHNLISGTNKKILDFSYNKNIPISYLLPPSCTEIEGSIKKFCVRGKFSYEVFLDSLSKNDVGDFTINSQKLGNNIRNCFGCTIHPQATHAALATDESPLGPLFIIIVNIEKFDIIRHAMNDVVINSMNFSPDTTKLVIAGRNNRTRSYFTHIIDFKTKRSYQIEQIKQVIYAAFMNNETVLSILCDGTVAVCPLSIFSGGD